MSESSDHRARLFDRLGQQANEGLDWRLEIFPDDPASALCLEHRQASIDAELDLIDDLLSAAREARVRRDGVSVREALGELTERYGIPDEKISGTDMTPAEPKA